MFSAAQTAIVTRPRKAFTPSQISVMRDLDRLGRAYKVRNGWKLGGDFRKASTIAPLVLQGVAQEQFKDGKHVLMLTYAGRTAVAMLSP
jgi:hypothetical protein